MARNVSFKVEMARLERDVKRLGKLPQTAVNRAAKSGAKVVHQAAKRNAPVDIGNLKKGLVLKAEKRTKMGKKMYFVAPSKAFNRFFVKPYAGGTKRAYYPASQEWGFTVNGHYTPGYRYLRKSIDENVDKIEGEVLKSLRKDVDRALRG